MGQSLSVWQQPEMIRWSQILVSSYQRLLGKPLIPPMDSPGELAYELYHAPFVVVSHDTQEDPIFNYGNHTALQLWSISWAELLTTPSRLSAEPVNRTTRARMLKEAATKGYLDNYQGVRITTTGKRFAIAQAVIWNLRDETDAPCGQAATFSHWHWL